MPKFFDSLSDPLRDWALQQQVFFTATAPLIGRHVNVSPKGLPASTFNVFDPNHAAYVDATGSGAETISHLYENGRITIMFCSFDQAPRIMRLFCKGRVVELDSPEFEPLLDKMGKARLVSARAVILLDIFKVQTSCGYGVPFLSEDQEERGPQALLDRKTLGHWGTQQVEKGTLSRYRINNNVRSLDGLGGLKAARRDKGDVLWLQDTVIWLRRVSQQWDALIMGVVLALFALVLMRTTGLVTISTSLTSRG